MKKLKRMLLIHWHNYIKEIVEFDTINFLTGKTAAGKSTVIDALQLVLLGDTSGTFFNKAANQKSTRTLKGYLFGEKGDDGDTGFRYIRNERFSSYVALEFEDTEKKRRFTTGIVCDCFKDQNFEFKWFILHNQGFPDNLFIDEKDKTPFDIRGLRTYLSNSAGDKKSVEYEFFETNKRYQEVTLAKFGQVKSKYRVLLRKAVPFSPISDIEQFITESICEVKNEIDIDQMQSDIRQYKSLEDDATRTVERVSHLKEISEINAEYENEKSKFQQQRYVYVRAGKEEKLELERGYHRAAEEKEDLIAQHKSEMEQLTKEIKELRLQCEQLEEEYHTSDIVKKEKDLREQLVRLQEKIKQLESRIEGAVAQVQTYGKAWEIQLEKLKQAGFEPKAEDIEDLIRGLNGLNRSSVERYDFIKAAKSFEELKQEVDGFQSELKAEAEKLKQIITELETTIENLKKGIKPYPLEVTNLRSILEQELLKQHRKAIPVSILADLLEIRNQRWRNAIEGYLDKQKFYLLVPELYYRDALRIYDRMKKERNLHDAGLVDIGKLKKNFNKHPLKNSLAEEIESEDESARLYADYLLGSVIKCEHVDELRKYTIGITDEGMLYKGFVSRNINPARYANPFIGRKSMELLLEQKKKTCGEQKKVYEQVLTSHRIALTAASTQILGTYEAEQHMQALEDGKAIGELTLELQSIKQEYDRLDFLYLKHLKSKIENFKASIDTKEKSCHSLDKKNVVLDTEIKHLKLEKLPEVIRQLTEIHNQITAEFEQTWVTQTGEPRFLQEQISGRSMEALRTGFYAAMRQTEIKKDRLRSERTTKRSAYNGLYKMPYDIEMESNQYFDKELGELEDIRLPEYIEKIRDSKEKAYSQFRDDFIARIKSNIESVSEQVDELNASLKQSVFGTDSYRFEKKPRLEYRPYYDMIMDPMLMDTGGWNLASQSFNDKYQKEIGELFQLLILNETNVTAERRAEYEKSIKKFTDYKTYLMFDLVVTNDQGEEQRLSKTLLKKSGGETQIPFYIALLASFSQVCRIRSKNQNNTIRVIILDEAFSKMDGERIKESIRLLSRFGLQAIFSAPPDKIPDIAPLVDRNIAVYKDSRHSFVKNFDPKEIDEELLED